MNKWLKATYTAMLAVGFLWQTPSYAAESPISVEVNGSEVSFPDASPFMSDDGRTMVPVRFISTTLGYHVSWNGATNQISIEKQGKQIILRPDQHRVQINGKEVDLGTPAQVEDNRLFVPVRFVSEALGQPVYWEPISKTVGLGQQPESPVVGVIEAKATAYGNESGNLDAMGNPLQLGTVSVDPDVIPLGTKLFITGYDYNGLPKDGLYAVASDRGGAIKGNRVDLYIPASNHEVQSFGIQNVKIQILK
ncbi:MAG TPA: stalk domain-containing protein [Bacillota bacterium]|nr:stalk domain-containing protein [Bacillota bacterium]